MCAFRKCDEEDWFFEKWIGLIILVNRESKGLIHPSRGLRKGDLLSPFLFLLFTRAFMA